MNGVETFRLESHSVLSELIVLLAVPVAKLAAARPMGVKPSVLVVDDEEDEIDVSQSFVVFVVLLLNDDN